MRASDTDIQVFVRSGRLRAAQEGAKRSREKVQWAEDHLAEASTRGRLHSG